MLKCEKGRGAPLVGREHMETECSRTYENWGNMFNYLFGEGELFRGI